VTYALIGDSQGVGLELPLRRLLGRALVFADPKSGWTTGRIRRDGPFASALASPASTIVLVTGGNDNPLDRTALLDMGELARAAGKGFIVVGPTFALTDDAARHDRARADIEAALRRKPGVRFVDAYPMTRDLARPENVHLTAAGYGAYAGRLSAALATGMGFASLAGYALAGYALARWLRE